MFPEENGHDYLRAGIYVSFSMLKLWRMLLEVVSLLLSLGLIRAQDVSFSIDPVSCSDQSRLVNCDGDARDTYNDDGLGIELTAYSPSGTNDSTGYVFYHERVRMQDNSTGQAASFSTIFTFNISRFPGTTQSGDGMAFIMYANGSYRGNGGGTLGVYNRTDDSYKPGTEGTRTFCIEFDTYQNLGLDASSNHVGVDLESIFSKKVGDAADVGIDLSGGNHTTAWIDYNFSSKLLEVRIGKDSSRRPLTPLLNYSLDLSNVVDEFMYVGIVGANGGLVELHTLYNWTFTTFGLPQPRRHRKLGTSLIGGLSATLASVFLLCCLVPCLWWLKLKKYEVDEDELYIQYEMAVVDMPYRFTYNQLRMATGGFSEQSKLGQGGSSSVYRGVIASSGTGVAVKKVMKNSKEGEKDFIAEMSAISRLRHRNLVKLLGWCSDRGNFLLVYELMPNGSLDKHLYGDGAVLSWSQRLSIVRGVAAALGYLHEGYTQQVIHRDIKSSNVMLDEEFNARLGDFGLARLIEHSKKMETTLLAGTIGYIAPEAVLLYKYTDKTDVYAFGALILEVACAKRPIDREAPAEELILVDWVWNCYRDGDILRAADPRLAKDFPPHEMEQILLMGLLCSHPDADARPSMRQVELIIAGHVPLPPVPLAKPVMTFSMQGVIKDLMNFVPSDSGTHSSCFTSSSYN